MKAIFALLTILGSISAFADCINPNPRFGRVVAICGDYMINSVGEMKRDLNEEVEVIVPYMEVVNCVGEQWRYQLLNVTESNDQNYSATTSNGITLQFRVTRIATDYHLELLHSEEALSCVGYEDTRTNIRLINLF